MASIHKDIPIDAEPEQVWAAVRERVKHYNASVQVLADGDARSRLIWIVDLLPNEIAPYIGSQMEHAVLAMTKAFMTRALARDPAQT
jgi:hypothetical protein